MPVIALCLTSIGTLRFADDLNPAVSTSGGPRLRDRRAELNGAVAVVRRSR
jgi:hypothetical protein